MHRVGKCVVGVAALLVCIGCGEKRSEHETRSQPIRDAVQDTVDTARQKAQELKERLPEDTRQMREQVRGAVESAKEEAERLKEQLPPADEVKRDLREAGDKAAEKLKAAGATIERSALEARQKIREKVREER